MQLAFMLVSVSSRLWLRVASDYWYTQTQLDGPAVTWYCSCVYIVSLGLIQDLAILL